MEGFVPDDKYQKLASEYAKLRAQASVLKKALLEEQAKSSSLRDQLRQKETTLRRAEQEIDSLGFRNKQLELRVASLQDDLVNSETKRKEKDSKRKANSDRDDMQQVNLKSGSKNGGDISQDSLIFEELQKKIMENAELTSLVDDKERNLEMHTEHIKNLELIIEKRNTEHADVEKRLRKDLELLQNRNQDLETKLVEVASMLGSEDALSASGSDYTPYHNNGNQIQQNPQQAIVSGCRITDLEKEVSHWKSQYELNKVYNDTIQKSKDDTIINNISGKSFTCSCTTAAAGLCSVSLLADGSASDTKSDHNVLTTKELLLLNNLGKKFEDLLREKLMAESSLISHLTEVEHLQNCLENATHELKGKDEQLESINQALHLLEEDLTTTRVNYDEQISVLTEQVISLSEQLAACK